MQMRSRAEVARILAEDIERALAGYRAVKGNSAKPGRASSSRLRHREWPTCMPNAETRELAAILALSETLQRHSEFALGGGIPEDLRC